MESHHLGQNLTSTRSLEEEMPHFPSKLQSNTQNGIPRRSDSLNLNATQQKSPSHPIFLRIEEELHDARRVHSDGQEDDLRYALDMVINRVSELSSLLSDAYKTQADLEVQLNVAKSNLQLVIANNEMLEDALKKDNSGQSKNIGWGRTSTREDNARQSLERTQSLDHPADSSPPPSASTPDNRFFKFRFSGSSTSVSSSRPPSRSESPQIPQGVGHHLNSPSMPSLTSVTRSKEVEDLTAELEKERSARKAVLEQKKALEDELESLSQALFEEANKMVADERRMRAETEEELKELKEEKAALRSALKLIEGENTHLRTNSQTSSPQPGYIISPSFSRGHTRSSSEIAIKSRPTSLEVFPPLPPSPSPDRSAYREPDTRASLSVETEHSAAATSLGVFSPEEDSQPTPRFKTSGLPPLNGPTDIFDSSPWADAPSSSSTS